MDIILVILSVLAVVAIAAVSIERRQGYAYIKWFLLLCASLAIWVIANYLTNHYLGSETLVAYASLTAYVSALIAFYFGVMFSYHFPLEHSRSQYEIKTISILVAIVALFSMTPIIAGTTHVNENGTIEYEVGVGLTAYLITMIMLMAISVNNIRASMQKGGHRSRQQALLVLMAFIVSGIAGLLLSVVIPVAGLGWESTRFAPVAVVLFVGLLSYSMVRHQLFDVRFAAVRTTGYIMTLATLVLVYFAIAYTASLIFMQQSIATEQTSPVNILIALVLAIVFQPIKQFFDRVTNRIFFRDRYDRDKFISELGDILTSTTTLRTMLDRTAQHIQSNLKAAHAVFVVFRDDKPDLVIGSQNKPPFTKDEVAKITAYAWNQTDTLVIDDVHDDIDSDDERRIRKLLRKHHIALILPLSDQTGYLMLGDQKASGFSKRDIKVLETISDELVIAIQNARSVEEVRLLNTTLQQRIDEATSELRKSNEKLRKLDATKDEFVSMASHQLRTPLTSIKGYISMLIEGDAGKITKQQEKLLTEAFTSSERMVRLISDFLNVSRLQTGKFMIDTQPTDLARVIGDEIESIRSMAESHGQTLNYYGPDALPDVMIDEDKTRQVIMNFIDNAIYYSPSGSDISVKLRTERGKVIFEVHDHGIGVPKNEQGQLFTKFFRAQNARTQRPDGTGVGLYLAKRVIEAQGGEIIFHSRPGMGSVFGFKLPLKK